MKKILNVLFFVVLSCLLDWKLKVYIILINVCICWLGFWLVLWGFIEVFELVGLDED